MAAEAQSAEIQRFQKIFHIYIIYTISLNLHLPSLDPFPD